MMDRRGCLVIPVCAAQHERTCRPILGPSAGAGHVHSGRPEERTMPAVQRKLTSVPEPNVQRELTNLARPGFRRDGSRIAVLLLTALLLAACATPASQRAAPGASAGEAAS